MKNKKLIDEYKKAQEKEFEDSLPMERQLFYELFDYLDDKSETVIKETYSDEELEKMRDSAENIRDLALIDILASTGMRIGELVLLNREDIDFNERECIVLGKGKKERVVYFDARTKIHFSSYK